MASKLQYQCFKIMESSKKRDYTITATNIWMKIETLIQKMLQIKKKELHSKQSDFNCYVATTADVSGMCLFCFVVNVFTTERIKLGLGSFPLEGTSPHVLGTLKLPKQRSICRESEASCQHPEPGMRVSHLGNCLLNCLLRQNPATYFGFTVSHHYTAFLVSHSCIYPEK